MCGKTNLGSFVSKDGVFYPQKERVALTNESGKVVMFQGKELQPGEPVIYEGPDRGALMQLDEAKQTTLGQDIHDDMDLIDRARQMGYTIDEYLKKRGHDPLKTEENFKKNAAVVTKHELPKRIEEVKMLGGGRDTSGSGRDIAGGFGPQPSIESLG